MGIPASVQNLLNVTGMTLLTNFTASFGANPVAAMGIAQKISMVPMYISQGISQGIMPLISYNYASGNIPRMKRTLTFSLKVPLSFQIIVALFFFFDSEFMIRLFMANEEVIGYGAAFLRGMCLAMPFSVSYTPLDVYKRQASRPATRPSAPGRRTTSSARDRSRPTGAPI